MSGKLKILFIVEGEQLEPRFIERMALLYGLECEITSVCTNIHSLYQDLKAEDGFLDVIAVLKGLFRKKLETLNSGISDSTRRRQLRMTRRDLKKLNNKFAYLYLVFDGEIQHSACGMICSQQDQLNRNADELKDMVDFFDNETDQGKLFINYPMMESYRDCDAFFDEGYKDRKVTFDILFSGKYKQEVGRRKLSNIRTNAITRSDFDQLIRMNVFKLNYITKGNWDGMTYEDFQVLARQRTILDAERNFMLKENAMAVLNTLLLFPLDYFGERLYDETIQSEPKNFPTNSSPAE